MVDFEPRKYGAVPFWFWNGDQDEEEITRQLRLAAGCGVRGMALHARAGNRTEYMSERWIELVRHACDKAKELGLEIWLYDEEGYPSGTVGGRLPARGDRFQQKLVQFGYLPGRELASVQSILRVFRATDLQKAVRPDEIEDEERVLAFWRGTIPRYIDALSREVADAFLEMTHRPYHQALGEYFGNPITFVYTDDLNSLLHGLGNAGLPYADGLEEQFLARYGYSLLDHLPALVEDVPECAKVRIHFRRLVLDRFLGEFVDPLYQWCDAHGVGLTGHLCGDEGPMSKAVSRFGAPMPFFESEHVPGLDDFLVGMHDSRFAAELRNDMGMYPVLIHKTASSVANQLKGGVCGCEVLTSLGWGVPLVEQSAQLLFEHALGVNLITHHDFSYATAGVAKRDHPASFFFQQPYWPVAREFHDQIARTSQLLQRGQYDADVLVIYPISSCWTALDGASLDPEFAQQHHVAARAPDEIEEALAELCMFLLRSHVGYEYGDEVLMERHGRISDHGLSIGDMTYGTVIIPPVNNLFRTTVDLLRQFLDAGGRVAAVEPGDCLVDGVTPERPVFGADGLLAGSVEIDELSGLRDLALPTAIEIYSAGGAPAPEVLVHSRTVQGSAEHFLVNLGESAADLQVSGLDEEFVIYDPDSDRVVYRGRQWPESFTMPRFSALHILPATELEEAKTVALRESLFSEPGGPSSTILGDYWRVRAEEPNVMLLDWCTLPDGSEVSVDATGPLPEGAEVRVELDVPAPADVHALLVEGFVPVTVCVNGTPLQAASDQSHPASQDLMGWGLDGLLQSGPNTISVRIDRAVERLEPMYLVGSFGVELVGTPAGSRAALTQLAGGLGDLVEQGLPFYWGAVTYEAEFEVSGAPTAEWIDFGVAEGAVELAVNGQSLGVRLKPPYRFFIRDVVVEGTNAVHAKLYNTAQNFFGSHRSPRSSGTATPAPQRGDSESPYYLMPYGVRGPVQLLEGAPGRRRTGC